MTVLQPPEAVWSLDAHVKHSEAMREADHRFDEERDRRYSEVNIEKAKAMSIKETADLAALQLTRESQSLREMQSDALRDKTLSESGVYATNASVAQAIGELRTSLQPLVDYVSTHRGAELTKGSMYAALGGMAAFFAVVAVIANTLAK